jgi:hypothetical protein
MRFPRLLCFSREPGLDSGRPQRSSALGSEVETPAPRAWRRKRLKKERARRKLRPPRGPPARGTGSGRGPRGFRPWGCGRGWVAGAADRCRGPGRGLERLWRRAAGPTGGPDLGPQVTWAAAGRVARAGVGGSGAPAQGPGSRTQPGPASLFQGAASESRPPRSSATPARVDSPRAGFLSHGTGLVTAISLAGTGLIVTPAVEWDLCHLPALSAPFTTDPRGQRSGRPGVQGGQPPTDCDGDNAVPRELVSDTARPAAPPAENDSHWPSRAAPGTGSPPCRAATTQMRVC